MRKKAVAPRTQIKNLKAELDKTTSSYQHFYDKCNGLESKTARQEKEIRDLSDEVKKLSEIRRQSLDSVLTYLELKEPVHPEPAFRQCECKRGTVIDHEHSAVTEQEATEDIRFARLLRKLLCPVDRDVHITDLAGNRF